MPELPEVENLVLELREVLVGEVLSGARVRNPAILQTSRLRFEKEIPGKKILQITRRGKFIRIDLSGEQTLWFHLGMTGQILLSETPDLAKDHIHLILSFSNFQKFLFYRDVRRFGKVCLTPSGEKGLPAGVRRLGPEPREWDQEDFAKALRSRRARIKSLLLNQGVVAGLGNIYADESLHRSGIHPSKRACRVQRADLLRLHGTICQVLERATRWGGSTVDDYVHLDARPGQFQMFHRVYGRRGERCFTCGTAIRTIRLAGRTSFFCPHCQK